MKKPTLDHLAHAAALRFRLEAGSALYDYFVAAFTRGYRAAQRRAPKKGLTTAQLMRCNLRA